MSIKLLYKCSCIASERVVEVRNKASDEDVVEWMEDLVTPAVSADHSKRSPHCRAFALEYLKIPVPENAPGIGEAPKYNA